MAKKSTITGAPKLYTDFKGQSLKGKVVLNVRVGYRARYAIWVHEDLWAYHEVGEAKYLSRAYRRFKGVMVDIVAQTLLKKKSLEDGLYQAGSLLKRESQELVPVDTGHLKRSAYVKILNGRR